MLKRELRTQFGVLGARMSRLPVIIGVGQHTYRGADDAPEAEPLRLIEAACRAASADSGADAARRRSGRSR